MTHQVRWRWWGSGGYYDVIWAVTSYGPDEAGAVALEGERGL